MTQVKAFKALIYNQEKIRDLSRVVCPPYDVISPERQEYYHQKDPRNFLHILLSRDDGKEDKYARAGRYFKDWASDGTFVQEQEPGIYFYWQQYVIRGEKRSRVGFIALLKLPEKNSSVFAHEHTRQEAKDDRLRLFRQVDANLSPIFVVFADRKRVVQRTYQKKVRDTKPFIDIIDDEGVAHKVWKVTDPAALEVITSGMSSENMYIADGHHRFEVACAYRDEMRQKTKNFTGEEEFNYVMAYFTNPDPIGLTIFPIHRLVSLKEQCNAEELKARLKDHFDAEEMKDKDRFFFLLAKAGGNEHVIGMYKQKKYWLLRLKNVKILDKFLNDKPREYRSLDVAILNCLILKKALGIEPDDKSAVTFSPEAEELLASVDNDPHKIAFLLNPVKMSQIMAVADTGERMPPKSTYFYPKVLSGLLIHKF